jgi:hypothetical protein
MESFQDYMNEYRKQLEKGAIAKAYKGLMEYLSDLKTYFKTNHPDYFVSSSIYYGYMDMTYFSIVPESLKQRNLKIAVVFLHEQFRFEAWLAGYNKQVQAKYWKFFKDSDWKKYPLVATTKGADSILEYILADNPDFSNLDALSNLIEKRTLKFTRDIEDFLSKP